MIFIIQMSSSFTRHRDRISSEMLDDASIVRGTVCHKRMIPLFHHSYLAVQLRWAVLGVALAACGSSAPTPTGTVCPDPDPGTLTWANFGQKFMGEFCTTCHDSQLSSSQRSGAPLYRDFDTLFGVLQLPDHIDSYAGSGPDAHNTAMPPDRCPSVPGGPLDRDCPRPSDEQRTHLSMWLACEVDRPH